MAKKMPKTREEDSVRSGEPAKRKPLDVGLEEAGLRGNPAIAAGWVANWNAPASPFRFALSDDGEIIDTQPHRGVERSRDRWQLEQLTVAGNQRIEAEAVQSMCGLEVGQFYSEIDLENRSKELRETGLFSAVRLMREGGAVYIWVKERPVIRRLRILGNREVSTEKIMGCLAVQPRTIFRPLEVHESEAQLAKLYHLEGASLEWVSTKITDVGQNSVDLIFFITEHIGRDIDTETDSRKDKAAELLRTALASVFDDLEIEPTLQEKYVTLFAETLVNGRSVELPREAPEIYQGLRGPENPPAFVKRVYGPWLGHGLTKAHIRNLDPKLYTAIDNWLKKPGCEWPDDVDLPTLKEQNDRMVAALTAGSPDTKVLKDARRIQGAITRRVAARVNNE